MLPLGFTTGSFELDTLIILALSYSDPLAPLTPPPWAEAFPAEFPAFWKNLYDDITDSGFGV